jgi:two-component system, NtrC family, sensor kinase
MTAPPDNAAPDPQQIIAELQRKLDESRAELAARNSAYSERIAYQAAANDVLKVMSTSPGDPQPVFDLIVERARDFCGGYGATVYQFDGTLIHWRAATGVSDDPSARQVVEAMHPMAPTREWPSGRAIIDRQIIHISDLESEPALTPALRGLTVKSAVLVPLMRGDLPIGVLSLGSRERGGFTETQIELLKTFAEQAVIAITSAETYRELQQRTGDLTESLQQQTATADLLQVISGSAFDLQPIFDAIAEKAVTLCGADRAFIFRFDGELLNMVAAYNAPPDFKEWVAQHPIRPGLHSGSARAALERRTIHIHDVRADPEYTYGAKDAEDIRTVLGVPIVKGDELLGVMMIYHLEGVRPFTEKQIALVETFADQAAIAIENVRLFDELRRRTDDLAESLQQQTATADVLKVISRSAFDLQTVFNTLIDSAVALSGALSGTICLRDGDGYRYVATSSDMQSDFAKWLFEHPPTRGRASAAGRVLVSGKVEEVPDILEDPDYTLPVVSLNKTRSVIGVPLLGKDRLEGVLALTRAEPGHFTQRQIELVQTFADQAVIAIENVRLFDEVQARTKELAASLDELRTAQDRLVQTEKLASLGQLTAGIAHEIKNPLNFVNNFSSLSVELIDELDDALAPAPLDQNMREELSGITSTLKSNLEKVVQHGKRADSIVKNMLLHSRGGSGERRSADINALVDESLNLAYHGARAEKAGFSIAFQRDLDPSAGMADVYPQEITRVLLNLISNGFYATRKRNAEAGDGFEPMLSAATKNLGDRVEIRIRDNGTGIPDEVKEKIFNPFFTTKPSGEGTGLGLSMSHDIIVKQHGGSIDVETAPGSFTEFKIVLPRTSQR